MYSIEYISPILCERKNDATDQSDAFSKPKASKIPHDK
jgi:hypothetical protein